VPENNSLTGYAINQGVAAAIGAHFLILNPDIRLEPDAVSHMVAVAQSNPLTAAVAAKLKFWWAPGFSTVWVTEWKPLTGARIMP